jgi:hypothetical protein
MLPSHLELVQIEGTDSISKILIIHDIIPSHLKLVYKESRNNIPKVLNYARYHSFTLRAGTQKMVEITFQ